MPPSVQRDIETCFWRHPAHPQARLSAALILTIIKANDTNNNNNNNWGHHHLGPDTWADGGMSPAGPRSVAARPAPPPIRPPAIRIVTHRRPARIAPEHAQQQLDTDTGTTGIINLGTGVTDRPTDHGQLAMATPDWQPDTLELTTGTPDTSQQDKLPNNNS